jgi:hypothetical protein
MKTLFIITALLFSPHVWAELYQELRCQSSIAVILDGPNGKINKPKGLWNSAKDQASVIRILDSKNQPVLNIYPWYVVEVQTKPPLRLIDKQTSLSREFRVVFNYNNKNHEISCRKF